MGVGWIAAGAGSAAVRCSAVASSVDYLENHRCGSSDPGGSQRTAWPRSPEVRASSDVPASADGGGDGAAAAVAGVGRQWSPPGTILPTTTKSTVDRRHWHYYPGRQSFLSVAL
uniref:(northern house mosquito) hypothetical protein n=1 Tax=Culex pipiens TaxID=7175 RepID=A0A8D8GBL1_CULPI